MGGRDKGRKGEEEEGRGKSHTNLCQIAKDKLDNQTLYNHVPQCYTTLYDIHC